MDTLPISITLNGLVQNVLATPRTFSTGSTGYNANGKIVDPSTGEKYQVSANIVLIGSKPSVGKKASK